LVQATAQWKCLRQASLSLFQFALEERVLMALWYLTDKACQIWDFQKAVVDKVELRQELKTYGRQKF